MFLTRSVFYNSTLLAIAGLISTVIAAACGSCSKPNAPVPFPENEKLKNYCTCLFMNNHRAIFGEKLDTVALSATYNFERLVDFAETAMIKDNKTQTLISAFFAKDDNKASLPKLSLIVFKGKDPYNGNSHNEKLQTINSFKNEVNKLMTTIGPQTLFMIDQSTKLEHEVTKVCGFKEYLTPEDQMNLGLKIFALHFTKGIGNQKDASRTAVVLYNGIKKAENGALPNVCLGNIFNCIFEHDAKNAVKYIKPILIAIGKPAKPILLECAEGNKKLAKSTKKELISLAM